MLEIVDHSLYSGNRVREAIGHHVIHALARVVGEHRAQQLLLGQKILDARQRLRLGLADELADPRFVVSRAMAWCDRTLKLPHDAMAGTRNAARAGIHEKLKAVEAESIEDRVHERFEENVQSNLSRFIRQ